MNSILMGVLWMWACAHQVSWQVQPVPSVQLPSLAVAVLADDRRCKQVADELVDALRARPGVEISPSSPQKLVVTACDSTVLTNVELESTWVGRQAAAPTPVERRRYTMTGKGRAQMMVTGTGSPTATLDVRAERTLRGQWVNDATLDVPAALEVETRLDRDLGWQLADKIVPLPETIRRTMYRDPEPGTARELHNQAVTAEQAGELDRARELARKAYAASPSGAMMAHIESLEAHASRVGYAFRTDTEGH